MKIYRMRMSPRAKEDLKRRAFYLSHVKKNHQAAANLMMDFRKTRISLETIAGSIREPDSEILKSRKLKRINFKNHDYFILFRIDGNSVIIMSIFHALEDFESKLD